MNSIPTPKLKVSPKKYWHWFIYVVLFSLVPIIINNVIDYWLDKSGNSAFQGIRLIDFLICAFCLIGGALSDRYNSNCHPSGTSVLIGMGIAGAVFLMYLTVKYQLFAELAAPNRYPTDNAWVTAIVVGYFSSIIYSLVLMRKTHTVSEN